MAASVVPAALARVSAQQAPPDLAALLAVHPHCHMKASVPVMPKPDARFDGVLRATEAGVSPPAPKKPLTVKYPRSAMDSAICGTVAVEALVDKDSNVKAARVVESLGQGLGLDEDAIRNVQSWKLVPAVYDGKAVPVVMVMRVHYFIDAVPMPPDGAEANIGRFATVCGELRPVLAAPTSGGHLFEFKGGPRSVRVLFSSVAGGALPAVVPDGAAVCVTGPVDKVSGRPQISVGRSDQFVRELFPADAFQGAVPGLTQPTLLQRVPPKYTSEAMKAKIQGLVELEAVVLPNGTIGAVRVVTSLDATLGLDVQAMNAARGWRFMPGMKDGYAVPVIVHLVLEFRLH